MELSGTENEFAEELFQYLEKALKVYREAGEKPGKAVFINPTPDGLQIIVAAPTKIYESLRFNAERITDSMKAQLPDLEKRVAEPLDEGWILLVLDGITYAGFTDFNYKDYQRETNNANPSLN